MMRLMVERGVISSYVLHASFHNALWLGVAQMLKNVLRVNVSSASAEEDDASKPTVPKVLGKKGIGKTGAHFRYHKPDEHNALNPAQRKELQEWRSKTTQKGPTKKQRCEASISTAVAQKVKEELAKLENPTSLEASGASSKASAKAFIMSAFEEEAPKKPPATAKATISSSDVLDEKKKVALSAILKRAKDQK